MQAATTRPAMPAGGRGELLDAIQNAQQAMVQHLVPQMAHQGLTAHQFWPLYYLGRGGETNPGHLAKRLGITAPACTTSIDHLVEDGFVHRGPSEVDRRRVVLTITPKGRRALDGVWRPFNDRIREAIDDLPESDVAVAARVLRSVADRLRAETTTARLGSRS